MEMNLCGVRSSCEPKIVLYQADLQDPTNPHGLLIAYAERTVKPVVSDFDTFLIGSKGMEYEDLPPEQSDMLVWSLTKTEEILNDENAGGSWTSRWLNVMKDLKESGVACKVPKFGFGDPVSYRLIEDVVDATRETGAIRHGAECFNYLFPQELDDTYLVVWHGFDDKTWEYLDEDELRDFMCERAVEGFVFPLNPIWLVRDLDWYEVYEAMSNTDAGKDFLAHYFNNGSIDVRAKLQAMHEAHPDGFMAYGTGVGGMSRKSLALDMDATERAGLALQSLEDDGRDDFNLEQDMLTSAALGELDDAPDDEAHRNNLLATLQASGVCADLVDMTLDKGDGGVRMTVGGIRKRGFLLAETEEPEQENGMS
jgi:hypothetical protein